MKAYLSYAKMNKIFRMILSYKTYPCIPLSHTKFLQYPFSILKNGPSRRVFGKLLAASLTLLQEVSRYEIEVGG